MKNLKTTISLMIFLLLFSFATSARQLKETDFLSDQKFDQKVLALGSYYEFAIDWRKRTLSLYNEMVKYGIENNNKIYARHLNELHSLIEEYHTKILSPLKEFVEHSEINFLESQNIFKVSTLHSSYIDLNAIRYEELREAFKDRRNRSRSRTTTRAIKVTEYGINPSDKLGKTITRFLKLQLASKLVLLDNFAIGVNPFIKLPYLRKAFIDQIPVVATGVKTGIVGSWHDYIRTLFKTDKLGDLIQLVSSLNETSFGIMATNKVEDHLDRLIESSSTFKYVYEGENNFFTNLAQNISFMRMRRADFYNSSTDDTVNFLSMVFGNTAGLFQSRKGKLYTMAEAEYSGLMNEMKALDVVFEKTPFRLTDKFIPGHFGHAAVWVGSEAELKELGVWSELPKLYQDAVKNFGYNGPNFQEAVRSGHRIIEALRPGVQFNTLRHFLDIDDLTTIRMKDCPTEKVIKDKGEIKCLTKKIKKEYLLKAFEQVGKAYDFNFDVNTSDKIVCSELIYRTFLDLDFQTDKVIGRHSISPDQVALKAKSDNDPFDIVYIYFNGERVSNEINLRKVFNLLLDVNYQEVEKTTGIAADYNLP